MNNNIVIDLDESVSKIIDNVDLKEKIEKIVYLALEEEKINVNKVFVSIEAVSKEEIRDINRQYRNVDKETDVLSFPIFTKEELQKISCDDDQKKLNEIELGDIILCNDVIREHAKEYETGLYRETLYMITHAMFHLLGYDHEVEEEKKMMRKKEEVVLSQIGEI